MRKVIGILLFFFCCAQAVLAQTTRVRGKVTDAQTGELLPFVGVYFDGTTIGISTDLEGSYSLETRDPAAQVLTASMLGYQSQSVPVPKGKFSEINFSLRPDPRQLEAALVKPDNRYIRSILKKLDQSLPINDPENGPDWNCRLYTRMELDATNTEDLFKMKFVERNLGYLREYADTSAITGKAFIPIMISENLSDIYHNESPEFTREVMRSSRISGLKEDNVLRQFTGRYLLKTNFYQSRISVFNLDIPNPAVSSSHLLYNYFLVDSLDVEGRKTYVLRFHPKKLVNSPTMDGEMQIDAQDFGIRSVHARLSEAANVNWLRHVNVDINYRRLPDGRWFFADERLFLDLSIVLDDESDLLSFLAHRQMSYEPPVYEPTTEPAVLEVSNPVIMRDVSKGDEKYWSEVRPFALSEREQGIYTMVDELQQRPFYKGTELFLRTWVNGYFPIEKWGVEFGRWARTFSHNDMEGFRVQMGGRTRRELSEQFRVGGYLAYGFKSGTVGWQATGEYMFNRETTRKLSLVLQQDWKQLGTGTGVFSAQNMFSSVLARNHADSQSRILQLNLLYDHEFTPNVNAQLEWSSQRIWSNDRVPFFLPGTTLEQSSFSENKMRASVRLSWDERVHRGPFQKRYLFSPYPVLQLDLSGGIKGITPEDVGYMRADAILKWKMSSSVLGFGRLYLEAGIIEGEAVPYPLLKLHAGNQTFFMDRTAFSCMDYYEFLSDRWLQGYYEHNFNGLFLSKIPVIKKWDLREVVTARFAWGTYVHAEDAPFALPHGSGTLESPYVEVGAGLSNIFRVLRVDALWRLTHRRDAKNFTINIGIDIDF